MNIIAILIGSTIGIVINKNIPVKIKEIVFQAIGLFTVVLGIKMSLGVANLLVFIFSLLIGSILGELIDLEDKMEKIIIKVRKTFKKSGETEAGANDTSHKSKSFSEGLVTAFLLFCLGSMTILGAIDSGIRNDHTLLYTKAILDGFTSVVLASTYGFGVAFSVLPVLIFQGGLTLFAFILQSYASTYVITQLSAVGGILILGLGINLLEIKRIRVINLLPSLVIVVILSLIFK